MSLNWIRIGGITIQIFVILFLHSQKIIHGLSIGMNWPLKVAGEIRGGGRGFNRGAIS